MRPSRYFLFLPSCGAGGNVAAGRKGVVIRRDRDGCNADRGARVNSNIDAAVRCGSVRR